MDLRETLEMARKALVRVNRAELVLNRKAKTLNSVGAWTETTMPLPRQWVRLARPSHNRDVPAQVVLTGGKVTNVDWLIIFEAESPDCIVGDTFEHPGTHAQCTVVGIDDFYVEPGDARLFVRAMAAEVR